MTAKAPGQVQIDAVVQRAKTWGAGRALWSTFLQWADEEVCGQTQETGEVNEVPGGRSQILFVPKEGKLCEFCP